MLSRLKLYAAGAALLVILLLAATVWLQNAGINLLKAERDQCRTANQSNAETIKALKADAAGARESCDKSLAQRARTIRRLREIDDLGRGGTHEPTGMGAVGAQDAGARGSADPLLGALNGMFDNADRQD